MKIFISFVVLFLFFKNPFFSQTENWTSFTAYHARQINDVFIKDFNNICLVGGNKSNDSIRSVFITKDGGNTWLYPFDIVAPWVKSVVFTSSLNGIAVGDHATILKTSDGGDHWSIAYVLPSLQDYHFNSVFFIDSDEGYIVGGNEALNKRIIMKSTNGGAGWNPILEGQGVPFEKVYFTSQQVGYTVGKNGEIYKTNDGGINWAKLTLPSQVATRDFKSLYFINENNGFITGGKLSNDSIQTILKTSDGGLNWAIIRDEVAPMLNDIYFVNQSTGYVVGNNGTVLKTFDGGNTWESVILPLNSINYSFNAVHFINLDYGFIAGKNGVVYKYHNPTGQSPSAQTLTPTDFNNDTIMLNASVNPNGYNTNIIFEYGFDENYGQQAYPSPSTLQGNNAVKIQYKLFPLQQNTVYHYRIKASSTMGICSGEDRQFYTGNPIPNFSFEDWDTLSYDFPLFYDNITYTVRKSSDAFHGNYAVKIMNDSIHHEPGVILMGNTSNGLIFNGGSPFHARPDSMKGYFKYNLATGDSSSIILIFKEGNSIISYNVFKIYGNSNNQYVEWSFPINYSSNNIPDTIILGATCANISNLSNLNFNDELFIDYIGFSDISDTIPNFDFEYWNYEKFPTLESWDYNQKDLHKISSAMIHDASVLPSNLYHHGKKSVLLSNKFLQSDTVKAMISSGKFPILYKPKTFTGYCFYNNEYQEDTLKVNLYLYNNGSYIGDAVFNCSQKTLTFEPFEVPINYNSTLNPDSASITIQINSDNSITAPDVMLDDLSFDSFIIRINDNYLENLKVKIFPNPASDCVFICSEEKTDLLITFYDILGQKIETKEVKSENSLENFTKIDVSDLKKGLYFIEIQSNQKKISSKIIVR